MFIMPKKNGFTLIEVLIVVVILAILSGITLGLLNSGGYRQKSRDTQRVSDIKRVQTALELYFADIRAYPASTSWIRMASSTGSGVMASLVPNYAASLPVDPSTNSNDTSPCNMSATEYDYFYRTLDATGTRYQIAARMEVSSSATASPCSSAVCASAPTNCYAVTSP